MKRKQKQASPRQRSLKEIQIHVLRTLQRNALAIVPLGHC